MTVFGGVLLVVMSLLAAYCMWLLARPFRQARSEYFLSHSSHDRSAALAIESELRRLGKTTWLDDSKPETRVEFRRPISAGLQRSRYGVLITSEPYSNSSNCREEAELLIRRFIGKPNGLVEVLLEPNRMRDVVPMPSVLSCVDLSASVLPRDCGEWQTVAVEIVRHTEGIRGNTFAGITTKQTR